MSISQIFITHKIKATKTIQAKIDLIIAVLFDQVVVFFDQKERKESEELN